MLIKKTQFITGLTENSISIKSIKNEIPQIAFIGRSNVGKSSTINALVNNKKLAKTSSYPGRTQQINVFLINDSIYFMDLPGYGYTKTSKSVRANISELINWYFLKSGNKPHKVVLIIDANVGPTESDSQLLTYLEESQREVIIVANKVDKIKSSEYYRKFKKVTEFAKAHNIIPFSANTKKGVDELLKIVFN